MKRAKKFLAVLFLAASSTFAATAPSDPSSPWVRIATDRNTGEQFLVDKTSFITIKLDDGTWGDSMDVRVLTPSGDAKEAYTATISKDACHAGKGRYDMIKQDTKLKMSVDFDLAVYRTTDYLADVLCSKRTPVLKEGTTFRVEVKDTYKASRAKKDDPVSFALAEDLKAGEVVLAKVGLPFVGHVYAAEKKSWGGMPGSISIGARTLTLSTGRVVKIDCFKTSAGEEKDLGVAAVATLGVGLLRTGGDGVVPKGRVITCKTNENVYAGSP